MIFSDGVGLGFSSLQSAVDASFNVNDISFTRSSNTISDVINDATFTLAADAAGKTATLAVKSDLTDAKSTVEDFISEFNKVTSYINSKTSITKIAENEYARGPLADESIFTDLGSNLLQDFMTSQSNDGIFSSLREIGLTINDSLQAVVSDQDLFEDALTNNYEDLTALVDSVVGQMDSRLSRYTGSGSYMDSAIDNLGSQLSDLNYDIHEEEDALDDREIYLQTKYAELQSQLATMQYTQQLWSGISSSMNRFI